MSPHRRRRRRRSAALPALVGVAMLVLLVNMRMGHQFFSTSSSSYFEGMLSLYSPETMTIGYNSSSSSGIVPPPPPAAIRATPAEGSTGTANKDDDVVSLSRDGELAINSSSHAPPTSEAPTSEAPTSEAPTSEAPTSEAPTSEAPTASPTMAPTASPTRQLPLNHPPKLSGGS